MLTATHTSCHRSPPSGPRSSSLVELCKASADTLRLQVLRVLLQGLLRGVRAVLHVRYPPARPQPPPESAGQRRAWWRPGAKVTPYFTAAADWARAPAWKPCSHAYSRAVDADRAAAASPTDWQACNRQREENSSNFFRDNAAQVSPAAGPDRQLRAVREAVAQCTGDAPLATATPLWR